MRRYQIVHRMRLLGLAALAVCVLCAARSAGAADLEAKRDFDIPAQSLSSALLILGRQTSIQIMTSSDDLQGVRSSAVRGTMAIKEALTQLLKGTDLRFETAGRNSVAIVRPGTSPDTPEAAEALRISRTGASMQRVASDEVHEQERRADEEADREPDDEAESEIVITGSRIRRDPLETQVNPVTIYSRTDIQRTGAINITDFVGRITQGQPDLSALASDDFPVSGRTTINLRGLGNNTTLILVDGRRIPKSGQGFGGEAYDLNGVPLGAVERIEVLTDGASAVYGTDAIGGVVNIITRQDFRGMEVFTQYGNTFDSDVSERNVNLALGQGGVFSGSQRRYSLALNASAYSRNSLQAIDRPYTASSDYSASGGVAPPPISETTLIGGGGVVWSQVGPPPFFMRPNLPGLDSPFTVIPAGQDGANLQPGDFPGSASTLVRFSEEAPRYELLLSPTRNAAVSGGVKLDWTENLQLFADAAYSVYESRYQGSPPVVRAAVPAGNPYNPFGVDVNVTKVIYELGPSRGESQSRTSRFALGARGEWFGDWQYDLSAGYSRYEGTSEQSMPQELLLQNILILEPEFQIIETPGFVALNSTDPATALNLFGDGRTTEPNAAQLLRDIVQGSNLNDYRELGETSTYSFNTNGKILQLRGGEMKVAIGAEYREESVSFENTLGSLYGSLRAPDSRDVVAGYAEVSVPVVGAHQGVRGVNALQFTAAGRLDSESVFGSEFTPKFGVLWKPIPSLAIRASRGEGYKAPTLVQLTSPTTQSLQNIDFFFPVPVDPVSGEPLSGLVTLTQGGNPDLQPERSRSISVGIIYEPVKVPGLVLSADYFDIDYFDKARLSLSVQEALDFFPGRIERDPDTGQVVRIDTRAVNLSNVVARGIDAKLTYRYTLPQGSQLDMRINGTYNIENAARGSPGTPLVEQIDQPYFPRVRMNGDLFLRRQRFEVGITATYDASTRNISIFAPSVLPERIRRAVVFDLQTSYDVDAGRILRNPGWWQGWKFTAGIQNLFDRRPSATDGDGGYALIDPRQRRFYVSLRKQL